MPSFSSHMALFYIKRNLTLQHTSLRDAKKALMLAQKTNQTFKII